MNDAGAFMKTKLETKDAKGVRVLRLKGSLTKEGVDQVGSAVAAATKGASAIVVDLSDVNLLATPGITMLLTAQRAVSQAGGRLIVTGTKGFVDELLRRCRLDAVLNIVPLPSDAMRQAHEPVATSGT